MSIKLTFDIGHLASRKTKPSKEGFTHDWELFVRGANDSDIVHFVEKVIFNLHESFPKPKRVIKEPPYVIKEAGYAGFILTIDIYFRNRDEPKKVTFSYDLDLQPSKTQMNEFVVQPTTDEFRRKCIKGGGVPISSSSLNDLKNRDASNKNSPMAEIKKPVKRPEETKPNKVFTDLFGAPLKKPDPRSLQSSSPNPTKLPSSSKIVEKNQSSSTTSGGKDKGKDKGEKHKYSPNKDGKDKKSNDILKPEPEKSKKDKPKDRERSDKKEKLSSSSSARNSTNPNALPQSKSDLKNHPKQSSTPVPTSDPSFSKKSIKKDKKSHEKERDRSEKKDSRSKDNLSTKDKPHFDLPPSKGSVKERESVGKDERDKSKTKQAPEPKTAHVEITKKQHDSERKHKHKKKEKTKDKDVVKDPKKEKAKNPVAAPSLVKSIVKNELEFKSHLSDKDSSDSDADSPPSIKQDSDNSLPDVLPQKPQPAPEKIIKKPRERTKPTDKEDKSRKRKSNRKDGRDSSPSPSPPAKLPRKDTSKSPAHERPSQPDSNVQQSNNNNNTVNGSNEKSNEYMNELKELKLKITTMKNTEELHQVIRIIAATGCYEITKSSFDFDLVQLDRSTVQRLQEFFSAS